MSTRHLQVRINDQRVGTLTEEGGIWSFKYTDAWCKSATGFPITSALPLNDSLQRDGSTHRPVQWFFDNLLPEETLREVIGKEEGVPHADAFGLLERLGAESAGALVLLPEMPIPAPEDGNGDIAEKDNKGAIPLSRNELSRRIRQLPVSSLSSQSVGANSKLTTCAN